MADRRIILILGASSDLGVELIRELEDQEAQKRRETSVKQEMQKGLEMPEEREVSCRREEESADIRCPLVLAHYGQNRTVLEELTQTCRHVEIRPLQADLSARSEIIKLLDNIISEGLYPTQIVSFAAQACRYMRISEWDGDRVQRDMEIQFYSLAEVFKVCLPKMAERGYGKAVVMLSAYTLEKPPKFLANYTSVKYALLGLMRSAAAEYGDRGLNINGISPAMIETKFLSGIGRKVREMNAENSPRHRNLTVRDVIPSVLYLLSDEAEFVNGVNFNLTGHGA